MRFIKILILLMIFILGLIFFVQNIDALGANLQLKFDLFYGYKWEGQAVPLYFIVLAAFGLGAVLAVCLLLIDRIRLGCDLLRNKRIVRVLEKEVDRLRNQVAKETKAIEKSADAKKLPEAAAAKA